MTGKDCSKGKVSCFCWGRRSERARVVKVGGRGGGEWVRCGEGGRGRLVRGNRLGPSYLMLNFRQR